MSSELPDVIILPLRVPVHIAYAQRSAYHLMSATGGVSTRHVLDFPRTPLAFLLQHLHATRTPMYSDS